MPTPRLGAPELVLSQAVPETTVNEQIRYVEQMASYAICKDKDLAAPPGSPVDGDTYIVAAAPTGAWTGWATRLAFYLGTAWKSIIPIEGTRAYLQDENNIYEYDGAAWVLIGATGPGLTEASNSQVWVGTSATTAITPNRLYAAAASVVLSDTNPITPDLNTGINFHVTLTGNRTLANPTNAKAGQSGRIRITQDATGTRTLTFGANWLFPGGDPTLSTAANAIDVVAYFCHSTTSIEATFLAALA